MRLRPTRGFQAKLYRLLKKGIAKITNRVDLSDEKVSSFQIEIAGEPRIHPGGSVSLVAVCILDGGWGGGGGGGGDGGNGGNVGNGGRITLVASPEAESHLGIIKLDGSGGDGGNVGQGGPGGAGGSTDSQSQTMGQSGNHGRPGQRAGRPGQEGPKPEVKIGPVGKLW